MAVSYYAASSRARSLVRKALKEGQMSSLRCIWTVWKLSAWSWEKNWIMLLP